MRNEREITAKYLQGTATSLQLLYTFLPSYFIRICITFIQFNQSLKLDSKITVCVLNILNL